MSITNNISIGRKGFIFSTDLIITIILMLFVLTIFIIITSNNFNFSISFEKEKYLEAKVIFVADSFVKNFNTENSLLGASYYCVDRKRILENEISSSNFSNIKQLDFDDFFIKSITVKNFSEKNIFFDNRQDFRGCISIKRMAFVDNIKSIITFRGCLIEK
jgi:hypothetical protein